MLVDAEKFSPYLCGSAASLGMGEHIGCFVKITGGAHLAPRAVFRMGTLTEILISQCPQCLDFLTVPHLGKALLISIAQHNAVAAVAGVVNTLGIEIDALPADVAHLGLRGAALGGSRGFVE